MEVQISHRGIQCLIIATCCVLTCGLAGCSSSDNHEKTQEPNVSAVVSAAQPVPNTSGELSSSLPQDQTQSAENSAQSPAAPVRDELGQPWIDAVNSLERVKAAQVCEGWTLANVDNRVDKIVLNPYSTYWKLSQKFLDIPKGELLVFDVYADGKKIPWRMILRKDENRKGGWKVLSFNQPKQDDPGYGNAGDLAPTDAEIAYSKKLHAKRVAQREEMQKQEAQRTERAQVSKKSQKQNSKQKQSSQKKSSSHKQKNSSKHN